MNKKETVNIIGAGFSSLAAACYLAKAGKKVHVFEKNSHLGGRANQWEKDGFKFDMGPTWYWMPDVFERFFSAFGKTPSEYYTLEKLSPAYKVYFSEDAQVNIPDNLEDIYDLFEEKEIGAGKQLKAFISKAKDNYDIAIKDLVEKPGLSPLELVNTKTVSRMGRFFTNMRSDIKSYFKHPELIQLLEFPVLFLGAKPEDTPSFYSFMNYADMGLGTWYPKGGMFSVAQGMGRLAKELGVVFHLNAPVDEFILENKSVVGLKSNHSSHYAKYTISGADYAHTETLLPQNLRQYSASYWDKKVFAPSALLYYVGFESPLEHLEHHCLFFDEDFDVHAKDIYDKPAWPKAPLFYASFPSITDKSIVPEGKMSGIFLIPLAPGLQDSDEEREHQFNVMMERLEKLSNQDVRSKIEFKQSYCINDFKKDYNSYKGNAYGMANTLVQTAFLRPKIKSKKVKNLYFTGQLTVPGPGVPPALISGKIVANQILDKPYE
ncbi:MAG: phytoene desaturase family protein [Flavobacteriales bacterium]